MCVFSPMLSDSTFFLWSSFFVCLTSLTLHICNYKWWDAMHEWFPIFISSGGKWRMMRIFWCFVCCCRCYFFFVFLAFSILVSSSCECDEREISMMWFNVDFCWMCVQLFRAAAFVPSIDSLEIRVAFGDCWLLETLFQYLMELWWRIIL